MGVHDIHVVMAIAAEEVLRVPCILGLEEIFKLIICYFIQSSVELIFLFKNASIEDSTISLLVFQAAAW